MSDGIIPNPDPVLEISPITHPIHASVNVPGSKSLTNRALLVASLADGVTVLRNALFSDDSTYFVKGLRQLGFEIVLDPQNNEMTITGLGGIIPAKKAEIFIGNAGTAARFLTVFLTLGKGDYILDGDARMRERPIGDLISALNQLGANVIKYSPSADAAQANRVTEPECPPVRILASGLSGGKAEIAGNVSSQFLSGLLMVAPYAENQIELIVTTEVNSKPYVDMTLNLMADFGVDVTRQDYRRFLIRPAYYQQRPIYNIEPDASAASYFFAAPAILGGSVRVENMRRSSRQGDIAFLDILQQMGCAVFEGMDYIEVSSPRTLHGVDVDMRDISDTTQTLAVIAPFADLPTHIHGIGFIRAKESNRITDTCTELSRLGVEVVEDADGFTIQPCAEIRPARIQTYKDHRMAMAFSLIGLRVPGVSIDDPGCVSKTFPNFYKVLEGLQ